MVILQISNFFIILILLAFYFPLQAPLLNEKAGFFGCFAHQNVLYSIFIVGPIVGVLGFGSYIFMLNYYPPKIVGSIFLLEPVSGQVIGILLGQDHFPGPLTYIGAMGIILGLYMMIKGDEQKQIESEEGTLVELGSSLDCSHSEIKA